MGMPTVSFMGPGEERSRWEVKGNDGQRWSSIKVSVSSGGEVPGGETGRRRGVTVTPQNSEFWKVTKIH
jgi:hypothetical protein